MNIHRAIKLLGMWIITSIIGGGILGFVTALGDTGHVGSSSTMLMFVVTGAIFGVVGGIAFAILFSWIEPRLTTKALRRGMAAALGALSGLLAISVVDSIASIAHAFIVGISVGAINGFICMVLLVSDYGHHKQST